MTKKELLKKLNEIADAIDNLNDSPLRSAKADVIDAHTEVENLIGEIEEEVDEPGDEDEKPESND